MENAKVKMGKRGIALLLLGVSGIFISQAISTLANAPKPKPPKVVYEVVKPTAEFLATQTPKAVVVEESVAVEETPAVAEVALVEVPEVVEQPEVSESNLYEVSIGAIYIRDNASLEDSQKISVWKKGHQFKGNSVKQVGDLEWLEIVEDCFAECETLPNSLWISKKYTNKI